MRAAQIFEPATPIKIREPRNLHLGRWLIVALLAVIGFGAYHVITTRANHSAAPPAATLSPVATAKPKVTATAAAHKAPVVPADEAVITLTATSDCWVGLTGPAGQALYQGTVQAGQTMTWSEKHPVSLVIGNPPGAHVTVNGKPQQMSTDNVMTLNIDPSSKTPVTSTVS